MDMLKKAAMEFNKLLTMTYYFEIARKNTKKEFILSFRPEDFHHIVGLHKLIDIGRVQTGTRNKIYNDILNNRIIFSDISISNYYDKIADRMELACCIEDILDSNQIVFKYLKSANQYSRIEADFLLENAHKMDIVYLFLSERMKTEKTDIPTMCCRSFFSMDKLDYAKNQPSYTLLKKTKINTDTGRKLVQYDRSEIMARIQKSTSEPERKSIIQQLNENKAKQAINDALQKKESIRDKIRIEQERF